MAPWWSLGSGLSFGDLSAAQVALLLLAVQYAAMVPAWLAGARLLPTDRRAAGWWAAHAAISAVALLTMVAGLRLGDAGWRALGHFGVVAAAVALHRGLAEFTGQRRWSGVHAVVLLVMAGVAWLGRDPAWGTWRLGIGSSIWAGLYLASALSLHGFLRHRLPRHLSLLLAAPLALAGLFLALRVLRVLQVGAPALDDLNQATPLGLASAVAGLLVALLVQMSLVALLLGRLVRRLERSSRHDPLTGLQNRRAIDALLAQEAQRQARLPAPLSVLMIDLDHFKQLNDRLGHAGGDRALQHLAALMAGQMREIDQLARWGGEEFVAVLPGTRGPEALVLAQRLCARLRAQPLVWHGEPVPVTATVGVAEWCGAGDSVPALLARADAALYDGKRAGRDRALLAADPRGAARGGVAA